MRDIAYYNGKTAPIADMTLPMNDRAVYFGDGVYDAAYVRDGRVFALDDHIARFMRSCCMLAIRPRLQPDALRETLLDLVSRVDGAPEHTLYFQATRGTAPRAHAFPEGDAPSNLLCFVSPLRDDRPANELRLLTVPDTRYLHCNIKTLNLIPNVMASQRAKETGCHEAVFHRGERVTEGAHTNISILKDGVFITAPLDEFILPGVTRAHLLCLCAELGVPFQERPFTLDELRGADEVVVTSSLLRVGRAGTLDGEPVGGRDGALYALLADAYEARIARETGEQAR